MSRTTDRLEISLAVAAKLHCVPNLSVAPAQAGVQPTAPYGNVRAGRELGWAPACAGATG